MRLLVCNPPWRHRGRRGLRCGAAPPRLIDEPCREVPWPGELATATAALANAGIDAKLVDSIATGESPASYLARLDQTEPDIVAFASTPASLGDDLPLLAETVSRVPVMLLWSGETATARRLVEGGHVQAVACGEPERALMAFCHVGDSGVYPPDPIEDLDDLPRAWRDHTVHLYRLPLRGLPDGPQLPLSVCRGQRWRSPDSLLDEIAFCRANWPRLSACCLVDDALDPDGAQLHAIADALATAGLPWAARVRATLALGELAGAAALEVRLTEPPDAPVVAALRRLAATTALTLAPDEGLDLRSLASDLQADVAPRAAAGCAPAELPPPSVGPQSAREAVCIVGNLDPAYMGQGLLRAARAARHRASGVDVYADPAAVRRLFEASAETIAIFDRGAGIPPELLPRIAARKVLYSPEVLPTLEATSPHAELRFQEFRERAPRMDDVILHDAHALEFLRYMGFDNIRGVVPLPVDPRRFKPLDIERDIDVLFVGSASEHRQQWVQALADAGLTVTWANAWGQEFVRLLNRARVVLNLHFTPAPNTELRVSEALACGSFVVSEPLTPNGPFRPGVHLVEVERGLAAEVIQHYLARPDEREAVAAAGRAEVLAEHTCERVLEKLLACLREPRA